MKIDSLTNTGLFRGIAPGDIKSLLSCIGAKNEHYQKGEVILMAGEPVERFGVVLSGEAEVIKEDFNGAWTSISVFAEGDTFGEVLAYAETEKSPVTVLCRSDCEVVLVDYRKILGVCGTVCSFHTALIHNLMRMMAERNLRLNNKIDYLMIRGMRQKICAYLLQQYKRCGNTTFDLPLTRSGLAGFLNVDRSALSRELSRMKEEKIIDYYRSSIKINDINRLKSL